MSSLLDTGFLLALLSPNDPLHHSCVRVMARERNPLLPTPVLPELAYMTFRNLGYRAYISFLRRAVIDQPRLIYPVANDFTRAADLLEQYADSKIDFVDCIITAMAERLDIKRILTIDQRDFRMLRPRHIAAFEIFP